MKSLNIKNAQKAASDLLDSLGVDLSDPNYEGTPERMVEVFVDFTYFLRSESKAEIDKHFSVLFPKHNSQKVEYKGMIVQSPVRVYSMCSHHFLPVIYDIAFAYIPKKGEQLGFSKIVRILRLIAK